MYVASRGPRLQSGTSWSSALILLVCIVRCQAGLTAEQLDDFNALSRDLTTLSTGAASISRLHLSGTALAVAVANDGGPMIAANRYGLGRVIHFGHEGLLNSCCTGTGLGGLVFNAAVWAAGTKTTAIRVAYLGMSSVASNLASKASARLYPLRDICGTSMYILQETINSRVVH